MFGRGFGANEIREEYNFGPSNADDQAPSGNHDSRTHQSQRQGARGSHDTPTNMEEMNVFSESDESLHRSRRSEDVPAASRYRDAHSSSFYPEGSALSTTEIPSHPPPSAVASNQGVSGGDGDGLNVTAGGVAAQLPEVSKADIVKEVTGRSNTNTNGMTVDGKEHALLVERWKNAMAEEERLNILQRQVEYQLKATEGANLEANFPPKFLCIKPLVNHTIGMVPEPRRKYVKFNYVIWMVNCVLLVANASVAITVAFSPYENEFEGPKASNKAQATALSIAYLLGVPLSFFVWHWPIYKACITGLATRHLVSLCGLLVALAFAIFMLVGLPDTGACGAILAMEVYEGKSNYLLIPLGVVISLWCFETAYFFYCMVVQWKFYRLDIMAQREARSHIDNVIGV